jgi:putative ABC transport system ATP-binding protein
LDEDGLALFRSRHVGILFQGFHLVPSMTAIENVALPMELALVLTPRRGLRRSSKRSASGSH